MKNTAPLPFPLILLTALVTGQWYLYGVCIGDSVVQVNLMHILVYIQPSTYVLGNSFEIYILGARKKVTKENAQVSFKLF